MQAHRVRLSASCAVALVLAASGAAAAPISTTVGTFTGGDEGEGLDLRGNIAPGYAVYAGPQDELASYQVQDAVFTNADLPHGIDINGVNNTPFGTPEYGDTSNDNNLENVMNWVRFGNGGAGFGVYIDAEVVPGQLYQVQLLFNEACCNRGFDVEIENEIRLDEFNPGIAQGGAGGAGPQNVGVVVTHIFTADDNNLDINLLPTADFPDRNAIIDAVTLELVPEPGSLALVGLSALGLLARRRRTA